MESVMKSDIFFFVTTIAVVVVSVGVVIALWYAVRILRDVKEFMTKARTEGDEILKEVGSFREEMKKKGGVAKTLGAFLVWVFARRRGKKKSKEIPEA